MTGVQTCALPICGDLLDTRAVELFFDGLDLLVVEQLVHGLDGLLTVLLGCGIGVDLDSREVVDIVAKEEYLSYDELAAEIRATQPQTQEAD